ncbi:13139_t:CDS:10, partial [Acaulospora morrowiae]
MKSSSREGMATFRNSSYINDQILNENNLDNIKDTFRFLERGGNILQNTELAYLKFLPYISINHNSKTLPFLSRYSQFDRICGFAAIDQNNVKIGIKDNAYPKPPLTSAMEIDVGYVPLNNADAETMMRSILQDIHDLTKSAKLFYIKNQNTVEKYCDFLIQNQSYFQYLRRTDVALTPQYSMPIMLYKWDLGSLGINYEDFLRALLLLENGPSIIEFMVINNPPIFDKIVKILVKAHSNLPTRYKGRLKEALEKMINLAPHHANFMRMILTDLKILPELAFELTLDICKDIPLYCEGIFTRNTKWLTATVFKKEIIDAVHSRLMLALNNELEKPNMPPTNHRTRLCILIRLVCGFVSIFKKRIDPEEIKECFKVVHAAESDRLKKICLSFVLFFAELIADADRLRLFSLIVNPANTQLYLLFAYFFNTNKFDYIEKLCRKILTLDVMISAKVLRELQYSTRGLFQEKTLARSALEMDPSTTFSDLGLFKAPQDFAFKCFYVMLKGGVFHKGGVDIQQWMLKQIRHAQTPIHAQFVALLKAYIYSIFVDHGAYPNVIYPTPITKIPESEIFDMFTDCISNVTPSHILMCYYILTFNSVCMERRLINSSASDPKRSLYSYNLTELIPVRKILFITERSGGGNDYKNIYPELLGLISVNYPEIFDIESLLIDEDREIRNFNTNLEEIAEKLVLSASSGLDDPEESALAMKQLVTLPPEVLYEHSDTLIIFLLPKLLDRMNFEMLYSMSEIWLLLYSISPHEASLLFINGLRGEQDRRYRFPELQIMLDPSLVFRIDDRTFRCPPLYKIFLRVLKFYMVGSRQRLLRIYQESAHKDEMNQVNLPLTIMEQETLLLSTVMEICTSKPTDKGKEEILDQIRNASFRFLHQIFIENSDSLKNLHFWGYAKELVPLTTSRIESMHTCMHWVHELINNEDAEKQMFGLCLAGHLCEVWPMSTTFTIAKNFMLPAIKRKIMNPLSKILSPEATEVLPILVKIHNIFEHLRADVVELLRELEEKLMSRNRYETTYGYRRRSREIISQCLRDINEKPRSDSMLKVREIRP